MNDRLEVDDIQTAAMILSNDGAVSRWLVVFIAKARGWRSRGQTPSVFVQAEVWREVDEDYGRTDRFQLGSLVKRDGELRIALIDGLDVSEVTWIARLCKERGFAIDPPPTAKALAEALA